ncbi:hypothetical protein TMatcc_009671 [Talaromyces marneffei ATCC 18224]
MDEVLMLHPIDLLFEIFSFFPCNLLGPFGLKSSTEPWSGRITLKHCTNAVGSIYSISILSVVSVALTFERVSQLRPSYPSATCNLERETKSTIITANVTSDSAPI